MEPNYISMALGLVISMGSLKVFHMGADYLVDKMRTKKRSTDDKTISPGSLV